MSSAPRPPARKPWPLWPIAVAIVVCLAGYTYLRLAYAKTAKPHEPYADNRRRNESDQLNAAGWTRTDAAYEEAVELPVAAAPIRATPVRPACVDELWRLASENWHLPIAYATLSAAAQTSAGADYPVHFEAELDQAHAHIIGFDAYRKGTDLILVPRWEPYPPELTLRRPKNAGRITLPAGTLSAGRYTVTLPALRQTSQWDLVVEAAPAP